MKLVLSMFSDYLHKRNFQFFTYHFEGYLNYLFQSKYWYHQQIDKKIVLRMIVEGR